MITEQGTVTEVWEGGARVATIKRSTCGSCAARSGCGQNLLHRVLGLKSDIAVTVPEDLSGRLNKGSEVEIGIAENAILIASLLTYGLPIIILVAFVALAEHWAPQLSILAAISGLASGYLLSKRLLCRFWLPSQFIPVVTRLVPSSPGNAVDLRLQTLE